MTNTHRYIMLVVDTQEMQTYTWSGDNVIDLLVALRDSEEIETQ